MPRQAIGGNQTGRKSGTTSSAMSSSPAGGYTIREATSAGVPLIGGGFAHLDAGAVDQESGAVDDNRLAAFKPLDDRAASFLIAADRHSAYMRALALDDEHVVTALPHLHGPTRQRHEVGIGAQRHADVAELARPKRLVLVG